MQAQEAMGTKSVAISDEAYRRLEALKKPGESFTDLIERMIQRTAILDLAGALTPQEGRSIKATIARMRRGNSGSLVRVGNRPRASRQD